MEFSSRGRRNTVIFAMLALVLIAFTLVLSTWQILRQQEEVSLQHMGISARSIAKTVENSYRRGPGRDMGMRHLEVWPYLQDLFTDVESGGDIQFIEIFDEAGLRLIASREKSLEARFIPNSAQRRILEEKGEWYGIVHVRNESFFALALRFRPLEHHAGRRRQLVDERSAFVVVGMSLDMHENMYKSFRNNALLQSMYILAAAIFVWIMAVTLLSRRALAGKTRFLERFQAQLLDNLPDGLITVGEDQYIQSANPVAHELLDFTDGSLVGRKISELPDKLLRIMRQNALRDGELGWRRAEALGKQLEILTTSFKGEHDEPTTLMLVRNRTRLHNLERSLAEAEKMAAVGTLAAGVAHEIRNPLAALRGFAQYFAKKFSGQKPEEEFARSMVREADRLNRVITDLLYLARNKTIRTTEVDLSRIVGEVEILLRFDLEYKQVALKHDFSLKYIQADADAVKQALLNLLLNSLDALEEYKGRPEASSGSWPGGIITVRSYASEQWFVLEVEDNGVGMTPEQESRAFDAFFTSKDKGTGLGLALVHKTMYEHGGHTGIRTAPMRGCIVSLYFPLESVAEDLTEERIGDEERYDESKDRTGSG
jgi:signal transduction histidine kinase